MRWSTLPALAGCLGFAVAVSTAGAQAGPAAGTPQSNPGAASPQAPGTGQDPAGAGAGQVSGSTSAQAAQTGSDQASKGSSSDKKFVKEAMTGSQAEITLGKLAQQKASSPDVKDFGQKMVDDHTKLQQQMTPVAEKLGVQAPGSLPAKDQSLQTKLEGLSGAAFDKAYMTAMVKDHSKDLSEFQKESKSAKDPQVKEAAQQGAPVIQEHLRMAREVAQKVGAKSGKMAGSAGQNDTMAPQTNSPSSTSSTPSTTTSPQ